MSNEIKYWTKLAGKFRALHERCDRAKGNGDMGFIAPTLVAAGKRLHELMNSCSVKGCSFYDKLKEVPEFPLEVETENDYPPNRYDYFWLYYLIDLGNNGHIGLVNPLLRSLSFNPKRVGKLVDKVPVDVYLKLKKIPIDTGFIQDVCEGSQELCKLLIKPQQKVNQNYEFPKTHIDSKEIKKQYNMGSQTLRDRVKKALKKGELKPNDILRSPKQGRRKAYPRKWAEENFKTYKPNYKEVRK